MIYKRAYTTPTMEALWDERALLEAIVEVERALAGVEAELGLIPHKAADEIGAAALSDAFMQRLAQGQVGNPLVGVLDALRAEVSEGGRAWIHYGATTQDILDTARALQIRGGTELLIAEADALADAVADLAERYATTPAVARTNGQHALPTTLGTRFARWLAEIERNRERLAGMRLRTERIQFSGAAGTYASLGEAGPRVADHLAAALGLRYEYQPWHASNDTMSELACTVAIWGQSLAKLAEDLFDMQRTDFGEAREDTDRHSSGSSTMPQKVNPFATMKIEVGGRLAAGMAATILMQPPASLERDHRLSEVQRDLIPQLFVAVEGSCAHMLELLPRVRFDEAALQRNLNAEGVLLLTESIMMELAPIIGRDVAHDLLQEFAQVHRESGVTLEDFIATRPEAAPLSGVDFHALSEPSSASGLSAKLARDAAQHQRNQS
ncbi:lyase family protein [Nigerium massiliense]|uniref:lyase family protein n=1 Tax=Nigerium massiliense TaxID=1522317 RepID=UPI000AB3A22C|nr:lyase family protein [Nigerium massiliense]